MGTKDFTHAATRLEHLDRTAIQAANAGRWDEAERCWMEMRGIAPRNRNALWGLGYAALQRGDAAGARSMLLTAQKAAPDDKIILMTLAKACRGCKDVNGELAAIQATLALDSKYLPGLLAMGALLERNKHPDALAAYTSALEAAPARPQDWPADARENLERAKAFVDRHKQSLFSALSERLSNVDGEIPAESRARWREAASIMAKITTPYNSASHRLFVPRLAAQPFHDTSQFPWVAALEAKTDVIRDELMRALEVRGEGFVPYVTLDRGGSMDEWKELNQSKRWSVLLSLAQRLA